MIDSSANFAAGRATVSVALLLLWVGPEPVCAAVLRHHAAVEQAAEPAHPSEPKRSPVIAADVPDAAISRSTTPSPSRPNADISPPECGVPNHFEGQAPARRDLASFLPCGAVLCAAGVLPETAYARPAVSPASLSAVYRKPEFRAPAGFLVQLNNNPFSPAAGVVHASAASAFRESKFVNEKNINQQLLLIGGVLLFGVLVLFRWDSFPQTNLRPGLDIAGGISMIFEIDDTGMKDNPLLAEEMKQLLQRRVDPAGVANLVWRVHGRNRLEVQMPLPPAEAATRREAFFTARDELFERNLTRGELEGAFALPADQRPPQLAELVTKSDATLEQLERAAQRYDAYLAARSALDTAAGAATADAATQPDLRELRLALRDALEEYEDAVAEVLATNLDERRFTDILEMDPRSQVRENSLKEIRQKHPKLATDGKLDKVIAAHNAWRETRGFLDSGADLRRLLSGSGVLSFRILAQPDTSNPTQFDRYREQLQRYGPRKQPGDTAQWFRVDNPVSFFGFDSPAQLNAADPRSNIVGMVADKYNEEWYVLGETGPDYELLGDVNRRWQLRRAGPGRDDVGRLAVTFEFDPRGGDLFRVLTSKNIGRQLGIFVDDVVYSAPNINSVIGAHGIIQGDFSREKVNYLVSTMQAGALPARLKETPLSERTIGSSLGQENLRLAYRSGILGLIATIAIITVYYGLSGVIANICMVINTFLTLAAMAMLGARVTLDGVAGLILGLGMAVDANVLIYERMREEKARGSSLRMIIKNGYDKALGTIIDSHITTLLTSIIIYYIGSEEIRGFGLMLGWSIALSLFTAVFVSRTLFALLVRYKLIREIRMMSLVGVPNIDWMKVGRIGVPIALVIMVSGIGLMLLRGPERYLDVEFLGGVSAEVEVDPQAGLNDIVIQRKLEEVGHSIAADAAKLAQAEVSTSPDDPTVLQVRVPGVSAVRLAAMLAEPLEDAKVPVPPEATLQPVIARGGVLPPRGESQIDIRPTVGVTAEQVRDIVRGQSQHIAALGDSLARVNVGAVLEAGESGAPRHWNITTTVANRGLVQLALAEALGNSLVVDPAIANVFRGDGDHPLPIRERRLDAVVPGVAGGVTGDLTDYLGGALMVFDQLQPPQPVEALRTRLRNIRLQAGYQDLPFRKSEVYGLTPADANGDGAPDKDSAGQTLYSAVAVAVVDPAYSPDADLATWQTAMADRELAVARAALESEQTLRKVSQFKPQIAGQSQTQALLAILLSWAMIIGYLWLRFGSLRYGIAGVIALVHDVGIALAFIGFAGWIGGRGNPIGWVFMLDDFKIDMTIIAAILTLIGYSINDKIVVFDRIRELRGRSGELSAEMVNRSINQTFSRTMLTGTTVLAVLLLMYIFGGSSIRGFAYCMFIGVVVGTFSSITVAAPLLLFGLKTAPKPRGARAPRPALT